MEEFQQMQKVYNKLLEVQKSIRAIDNKIKDKKKSELKPKKRESVVARLRQYETDSKKAMVPKWINRNKDDKTLKRDGVNCHLLLKLEMISLFLV